MEVPENVFKKSEESTSSSESPSVVAMSPFAWIKLGLEGLVEQHRNNMLFLLVLDYFQDQDQRVN
jgi:hypothetical protein